MPVPFGYPQPRASQFIADAPIVTAPYGTDGVFAANHLPTASTKRLFINCYYDGTNYRAITAGYCAIIIIYAGDWVMYQTTVDVAPGAVISLYRGRFSTGSLLQDAPTQAVKMTCGLSDDVKWEAGLTYRIVNTTYAKQWERQVPAYYADIKGVRVTYEVRADQSLPVTAYARIYVNGAAFGPEHVCTSSGYVTYTDDLVGLAPGDNVELWVKASVNAPAYNTDVRHLTLKATDSIYNGVVNTAW